MRRHTRLKEDQEMKETGNTMKVFISCDIEGTALTTTWDECYPQTKPTTSGLSGIQHTAEVKAACEGAIAAGAAQITVRDGHNSGTHIDVSRLPECVEVIRGWTGGPLGMVQGVDQGFDAALFIGYHSAAGRVGNPLCHTESRSVLWMKINGRKCSEFMLFSWAAAMCGVPTVFLSGDKMLIDDYSDLHPGLVSVAVKDGFGGMTTCIHPEKACRLIREGVERSLRQNLSGALCTLPDHFVFEICYKEMVQAVAMSYYPGFVMADDNTIKMETDNYEDILRAVQFVLK